MATIYSCTSITTKLPAVNLRRPIQFQQTAGRGIGTSIRTSRKRSHVVVASAAATSTTEQEQEKRGSLAEESGRSDGELTARWREIHGSNNWEGLLDPIDTTLRGELIRYGELAQACYDSFDYDRFSPYCGTCRYPPQSFFRDVGLDGVGYRVSRYLYATASAKLPRFSFRKVNPQAWSETGAFIGFVAVSTDEETARIGRRDIAVAWRGTVTTLEWLADLTATQTPVSELGIPCPDPNVKVETGFGELYVGRDAKCKWCRYSAREQVLAEVRRLLELYRGEEVSVTVTGHSLGGALAMLSAYDIAETGANRGSREQQATAPVCVFSFSGPRVGNLAFKERFEGQELGVRALRVVNVHDKVQNAPGAVFLLPVVDDSWFPYPVLRFLDWLPLGYVYAHAGVELELDHTRSPFLKETFDPACHHNLEAHLHLLDGYQGRDAAFQPCGRDPALVNKAADFLRDEHLVPPAWRQDANKGMIRTEDGRWVLAPRSRNLDLHPDDIDHHLQQLGLIATANS